MSLLSAIPGLSAHRVELPQPALDPEAVPEFDKDKATRLVREAVGLITSLYPAGALEWLRDHRPDVIDHLRDADGEVESAALSSDRARLVRALDAWTRRYQKAFQIYNERPPVIERQDDLFNGGA